MKRSALCFLLVCIMVSSSVAQFGDRGPKMTQPEITALADSVNAALNRCHATPSLATLMVKKVNLSQRSGVYQKAKDRTELADLLTSDLRAAGQNSLVMVRYYPVASRVLETTKSDSLKMAQLRARLKAAEDSQFGFNAFEVLPGKFAYLRWDHFSEFTGETLQFFDSAFYYMARCNALMVDLRFNSGGSAATSLGMLGFFFDRPVASNRLVNGQGDSAIRMTEVSGTRFKFLKPVYVLTSSVTAGAAEDLAYALQQARRAVVVGDTSAGVASTFTMVSLGQGFVMSLPFEHYVSPHTRSSWQDKGVLPDQPVVENDAMARALLIACTRQLSQARTEEEKTILKRYLLEIRTGKYSGIPFVAQKNSDARHAITIKDSVYGPANVSRGPGAVMDFKTSGPYLSESNSAWFRLTFEKDTLLTFDIVPLVEADDYDFTLFRCSGNNCLERIRTGEIQPERLCHSGFSSYNGATGMSEYAAPAPVGAGPGPTYVQAVRVKAGETFYLLVDVGREYIAQGQYPRGFMIYFHDYWPKKKPVALNKVFFEVGRATLTKPSLAQLDKLVAELRKTPAMSIEIRGHTDNQGSEEINRQLSADRAAAVRAYLLSRGIDHQRIRSKGFGSSQPLAPNSSEAGRKKNRRVEFALIMR